MSSFCWILVTWCLVALLRVLVGYNPHSGQDNYHGNHAAYGGDFEAQRHWMELTYHLPVGQWYWYDLEYWGLDYPPLSAYLSWLCAYLSSVLVGPETVALVTSRGWEDPIHKAFMRATVLVLDMLLYAPACWIILKSNSDNKVNSNRVLVLHNKFVLAMIQPAILLIDHGHFQYNTTALGLSLWAFYFMTRDTMTHCLIGSVFFSLALSFKQMTLYYAPAVFAYLLGRCFTSQRGAFDLKRFLMLGITVITVFASLWWPFVVYGPDDLDTTPMQRLHHVFRRIIPIQRGLFEGKVSNLWCALSVKPIRLRQKIPSTLQPIAALLLTIALFMPCCIKLFQIGRAHSPKSKTKSDCSRLLWGATNCSLAFFLASFQVHEKSLLLALSPASLLFEEDSVFVEWFSIVTAWTLWPLVVLDRLQVAYVCTILIFISVRRLEMIVGGSSTTNKSEKISNSNNKSSKFPKWFAILCYCAMLLLHALEWIIIPPSHLPDLFPVLWSVAGCGFCCFAWLVSMNRLYREKVKMS